MRLFLSSLCVCQALFFFVPPKPCAADRLSIQAGTHLVLLGNGLGSRMGRYGHFETEMHLRYPSSRLFIRNMCDEGNTPAFRPHSARNDPWPFPGAEKYRTLGQAKDRWGSGHAGRGFYEKPDQWLTRLKADVIVAFFGFNESFEGGAGLDRFKAELADFINHTRSQKYNGKTAPQLALVSPVAFENLSATHGTPDGTVENTNLSLYTAAMEDVAKRHGVLFLNLFSVTQRWMEQSSEPLTRDGALLTEAAYRRLAPVLAEGLFGKPRAAGEAGQILKAVREKNWYWHKFYKIPNGVHVFGRRHNPHGPKNYPHELKKIEQMVANRDEAVWAVINGRQYDLAKADAATHKVPQIGSLNPKFEYKYGDDAVASIKVAEGYRIELFASEQEFPNLANPSQLAFDNRGRLWVATMPTYPHFKPGDAKPNDKLIILEDTNNDGKADKETVFVDDLHLPLGFEFAPDGVYVSQGGDLVLLRDDDLDDKVDGREIILSGFDDHDTHHAISAFCADPSGAIIMGEGTFLHSNVETAYGPIRSSNGGFFRFTPQRGHLERSCRVSIPNPWGTAFDEWGQDYFTDTSDPNLRWMLPASIKVPYGDFAPNPWNLLEQHRVRPTSGLEFVSSRHFPEEVQGDVLINNTIGFRGAKQHRMVEDGAVMRAIYRHDLMISTDRNFRPVDMEFAPDGSLYVVDWHNALIGHMQHNARDVNRDHAHGRVFRLTYPSRPLVKPAKIFGASILELLENLKLPEYRTRYRTRRELRGRDPQHVLSAVLGWVDSLDAKDKRHEHHLLEALWVTWGHDRVDVPLLKRLLSAKDYRARAAAVRVLRYNGHRVPDQAKLLAKAVKDPHGRVRLEANVASTWLSSDAGRSIFENSLPNDHDRLNDVYAAMTRHYDGAPIQRLAKRDPETHLTGQARELFVKGAEVYGREGHCVTCHQPDGTGLPAAQFPPLAKSEWVTGSAERLAKLVLHGITGPISVNGTKFPGTVPMVPFKHLSDDELAAVLTYVRNAFGNRSSAVVPAQIKVIRSATKERVDLYTPDELLEAHPD